MNLKECVTCGSHDFNGNKCAYCGNVYEVEEDTDCLEEFEDYEPLNFPEMDEVSDADLFVQSETGQKISKALIYILVSIIWFAITVFIPPLFILTICGLIIWGCKWLIKKGEKKC
jgi:hypothetical protein